MRLHAIIPMCAGLMLSVTSAHGEDLMDALRSSKPVYESSLRYEGVSQQGFGEEARALTWRNRLGIETGSWRNWSALVEVDMTHALNEHYDSTLNGRTLYPAVPDPQVAEINRAQLRWSPQKGTQLVLGRQRIVLDDGRFVGNAGWRQDEQTFDALRFDTARGKFSFGSAYIIRVNRIQGEAKDWKSESVYITGGYDFAPQFRVQGFHYDLSFTSDARSPVAADIANARAASVKITGARVSGAHQAGDFRLSYGGYYAVETEGRGNAQGFRLEAKSVDLSAGYGWVTGQVSYESLGGNGVVGFVTPLSSPHPFQGFADAFSATGGMKTHVNGIVDVRASLTVAVPGRFKPSLKLIRHDFTTARQNQDLGVEWDAVATFALTPKFSLMLKYADFERGSAAGPASRTKGWVMLQYRH